MSSSSQQPPTAIISIDHQASSIARPSSNCSHSAAQVGENGSAHCGSQIPISLEGSSAVDSAANYSSSNGLVAAAAASNHNSNLLRCTLCEAESNSTSSSPMGAVDGACGGGGGEQLHAAPSLFPSADVLEAHIASEHFDCLPYQCERCRFSKFPTEYSLRHHYEHDHKMRKYYIRFEVSAELDAKKRKIAEALKTSLLQAHLLPQQQQRHSKQRSAISTAAATLQAGEQAKTEPIVTVVAGSAYFDEHDTGLNDWLSPNSAGPSGASAAATTASGHADVGGGASISRCANYSTNEALLKQIEQVAANSSSSSSNTGSQPTKQRHQYTGGSRTTTTSEHDGRQAYADADSDSNFDDDSDDVMPVLVNGHGHEGVSSMVDGRPFGGDGDEDMEGGQTTTSGEEINAAMLRRLVAAFPCRQVGKRTCGGATRTEGSLLLSSSRKRSIAAATAVVTDVFGFTGSGGGGGGVGSRHQIPPSSNSSSGTTRGAGARRLGSGSEDGSSGAVLPPKYPSSVGYLRCKACGELITNRQTSLNYHINSKHLRLALYECSYPGCGKVFHWLRKDAHNHVMRKHNGDESLIVDNNLVHHPEINAQRKLLFDLNDRIFLGDTTELGGGGGDGDPLLGPTFPFQGFDEAVAHLGNSHSSNGANFGGAGATTSTRANNGEVAGINQLRTSAATATAMKGSPHPGQSMQQQRSISAIRPLATAMATATPKPLFRKQLAYSLNAEGGSDRGNSRRS